MAGSAAEHSNAVEELVQGTGAAAGNDKSERRDLWKGVLFVGSGILSLSQGAWRCHEAPGATRVMQHRRQAGRVRSWLHWLHGHTWKSCKVCTSGHHLMTWSASNKRGASASLLGNLGSQECPPIR